MTGKFHPQIETYLHLSLLILYWYVPQSSFKIVHKMEILWLTQVASYIKRKEYRYFFLHAHEGK